MLIIINATGLKKLYVMPKIGRRNNQEGLWYWSITWLIVELSFYSKVLGARMIQELNAPTKATPQGNPS